jgi:hypothetical protein
MARIDRPFGPRGLRRGGEAGMTVLAVVFGIAIMVLVLCDVVLLRSKNAEETQTAARKAHAEKMNHFNAMALFRSLLMPRGNGFDAASLPSLVPGGYFRTDGLGPDFAMSDATANGSIAGWELKTVGADEVRNRALLFRPVTSELGDEDGHGTFTALTARLRGQFTHAKKLATGLGRGDSSAKLIGYDRNGAGVLTAATLEIASPNSQGGTRTNRIKIKMPTLPAPVAGLQLNTGIKDDGGSPGLVNFLPDGSWVTPHVDMSLNLGGMTKRFSVDVSSGGVTMNRTDGGPCPATLSVGYDTYASNTAAQNCLPSGAARSPSSGWAYDTLGPSVKAWSAAYDVTIPYSEALDNVVRDELIHVTHRIDAFGGARTAVADTCDHAEGDYRFPATNAYPACAGETHRDDQPIWTPRYPNCDVHTAPVVTDPHAYWPLYDGYFVHTRSSACSVDVKLASAGYVYPNTVTAYSLTWDGDYHYEYSIQPSIVSNPDVFDGATTTDVPRLEASKVCQPGDPDYDEETKACAKPTGTVVLSNDAEHRHRIGFKKRINRSPQQAIVVYTATAYGPAGPASCGSSGALYCWDAPVAHVSNGSGDGHVAYNEDTWIYWEGWNTPNDCGEGWWREGEAGHPIHMIDASQIAGGDNRAGWTSLWRTGAGTPDTYHFVQLCANPAYRYPEDSNAAETVVIIDSLPFDCSLNLTRNAIEVGEWTTAWIATNHPELVREYHIWNSASATATWANYQGAAPGDVGMGAYVIDNRDGSVLNCRATVLHVAAANKVVGAISKHWIDGIQNICMTNTGEWWTEFGPDRFYCANHFNWTLTLSDGTTRDVGFAMGHPGCNPFPKDTHRGLGYDWSLVDGMNPVAWRFSCQTGCGGHDPTVIQVHNHGTWACVHFDDGAVGNQPGAVEVEISWQLSHH